MKENRDIGVFIFEGGEDEVAMRWMWTCLCDLTWHGMIETILRIIFRKPPKWVFKK